MPKWAFFLGWAGLVFTAWAIWYNAAHPTTGLALICIVVCVNVAAAVIAIPFITDYFAGSEEALDNRQRSLQSLSVTVASAAEQVSIAATGLQGISEAAQDNFSKFERLSKQVEEKIAELDSRLAAARKDDGETAARYEAAAKKISKAAAEFEAGVAKAAEAARAAAAAAAIPAHAPEAPPVIASRIVEIRPAVRASDHPFTADEEPKDPKPEVAPAPVPAAEPAAEAPAAETPAAVEATPSAEPAAPPPKKRAPRKPPTPQPTPPAQDLVLESPPAAEAAAAPEISEPAVSADGATRLVVTAYIGIGNRLFIRGEGPGLSWEKGVPLNFVSIGKWRWETNDASGPVRFKLYKNDEAECSALGERSIEPGAQQELTASF